MCNLLALFIVFVPYKFLLILLVSQLDKRSNIKSVALFCDLQQHLLCYTKICLFCRLQRKENLSLAMACPEGRVQKPDTPGKSRDLTYMFPSLPFCICVVSLFIY